MARFDVRKYALRHLDNVRDEKADELQADCFSCSKPGHLYVNAETGNFICFKCEAAGRGFIALVAEVEGLSQREVRRRLLKEVITFRKPEKTETLAERVSSLRPLALGSGGEDLVDVPLPEAFISIYNERSEKWRFPKYLKKRGVTRDAAKFFGMGFCATGRYFGRVVIPIKCPNGRSFTARDTTGESEVPYLNPRKTLKMGVPCEVCDEMNCEDGSHRAQHKKLLLGWQTLEDGSDTFIVEGPMDVVKMWQHGFPVVGLLGKAISDEKRSLLYRMNPGAVIVMLDPEEQTAPIKVARAMASRFDDVYIAKLPEGTDPGSATKEEILDAYLQADRFRGDRALELAAATKEIRNPYVSRKK